MRPFSFARLATIAAVALLLGGGTARAVDTAKQQCQVRGEVPVEVAKHRRPGSSRGSHVPTISSHYAGYVNGVPTTAVRLNAGWIDDLVYLKLKGRQWDVASGPPASGAHARGEVVFNEAPEAGGPPGWMCVASGAPGTWKAVASLAP